MTLRQGYIEMQNPALMPLVIGNKSSRKDVYYGDGKPAERFAMFAEVYGPFHEDSMELKEEKAYQRGMAEHIRESMEDLNRLKLFQDQSNSLLSQGHSPSHGFPQPSSPGRNYLGQTETPLSSEIYKPQYSEETWHRNSDNAEQSYGMGDVWEDLSIQYKPKVTYYELAQKTARRPILQPPPKTYTEIQNAPKTYTEMKARSTAEPSWPSQDVYYAQKHLPPSKALTSLPNGLTPEEFWEKRMQSLGKLTNRSTTVNTELYDPKISHLHQASGDQNVPFATVRLPIINTGRSVDQKQNNDETRQFSIDISLNLPSSRNEIDLGQPGQYRNMNILPARNSQPLVPPLALSYQTDSPLSPQTVHPVNQKITATPRGGNVIPIRQQEADPPGRSTSGRIYPYRQLNNPWFPPEDHLPPPPPTIHQHFRKGKYGPYKVFDINDYKKLQKELRLGSLVGAEKDVETLQEKKEKRAVHQEYGKLIRAKNREETKPRLTI